MSGDDRDEDGCYPLDQGRLIASLQSTRHMRLPSFHLPAQWGTGLLSVSDIHRIAYSQRGRPDGIPVLLFHGGPGSCSSPAQAGLFDPRLYRVVQFDQRGCGASLPSGETQQNQTALLLQDAEALRVHLGIGNWMVAGGSWGAALAVLYAAAYPAAVSGLLLRSIFLAESGDLKWFFHDAAELYPEIFEAFIRLCPHCRGHEIPPWLDRVFRQGTRLERTQVAYAWNAWERVLAGLPPESPADGRQLNALLTRYTIQSHYLAHNCWLAEGQVLAACAALKGLPAILLHGTADHVCRSENALRTHRALEGSVLEWIDGAGHDPFHPVMVKLMTEALLRFADTGRF